MSNHSQRQSEDNAPKETMLTTITFMEKSGTKDIPEAVKEDIPTHQLKKEEREQEYKTASIKLVDKQVATTIGLVPIILRYVPKSIRKGGESLFIEYSIPNITKAEGKHNKVNSSSEKRACLQSISHTVVS